jgi:hypothetical protein
MAAMLSSPRYNSIDEAHRDNRQGMDFGYSNSDMCLIQFLRKDITGNDMFSYTHRYKNGQKNRIFPRGSASS